MAYGLRLFDELLCVLTIFVINFRFPHGGLATIVEAEKVRVVGTLNFLKRQRVSLRRSVGKCVTHVILAIGCVAHDDGFAHLVLRSEGVFFLLLLVDTFIPDLNVDLAAYTVEILQRIKWNSPRKLYQPVYRRSRRAAGRVPTTRCGGGGIGAPNAPFLCELSL